MAIELEAQTQFDQVASGNGASLSLGTGVTDLLLNLAFRPAPAPDGVPNGIEFFMGRDPRLGFPDPENAGENIPLVDETHLRFVYRRDAAERYLSTVVQHNSDLSATWNQASAGVNGLTIATELDFYGSGIDKVETRTPSV